MLIGTVNVHSISRALLATIALALVLVPTSAAQPSQNLEAKIHSLMKEAEIPGLTIATVAEGQVDWHGAFGIKNSASGEQVEATTIFEAASLSKPVFAYAVLRLVERGEIDLDQPIWDIVPYDRLNHDERAKYITPRMVLSHTSGLPNWGGTPLELNRDPGERWGYSGEGFVYLQRAVERLTDMPLDEFARREVFEPLGMLHSAYIWRDAYDEASATGHDMIGETQDKQKPTDGNAAASLHTTAQDYAQFLAAVLRGDGLTSDMQMKYFSEQSQVQGWGPQEFADSLQWGLGWGLQRGSRGKAIWHWGDNGSFRAYVVGYPETTDGLVYFTNSENGLTVAEGLVTLFFDDTSWATRWLDYGRHDDPTRKARIKLRRAFLQDGADKGLALYQTLRTDATIKLDANELRRSGRFLLDRGRAEEAVTVLETVVATDVSLDAHIALADAYTAADRYKKALETYASTLKLEDADEENLRARMAWLQNGIMAAEHPVSISVERLQAYVGKYGPRVITVRDGQLYYAREGATSETLLLPLTDDMFALESNKWFRIRFEMDGSDRATKIIGLYADGRTDESVRDS